MSTPFQPPLRRTRSWPTRPAPAVRVSGDVARENLIEAFSFLSVRRRDRERIVDTIQQILERQGAWYA